MEGRCGGLRILRQNCGIGANFNKKVQYVKKEDMDCYRSRWVELSSFAYTY